MSFIYPTNREVSAISKAKAESEQAKSLSFIPELRSLVTFHLILIGADMGSRLMGTLRSIMGRLRGNATYVTLTPPKSQTYVLTADSGYFLDHHQRGKLEQALKGDFVPVYVATGVISLSTLLGLHTAKQQLCYSPNVRVNKKTRESLPEVEYPEKVVDEADKFVNKSFFRKVAHVQEFEYGDHPIPDPIRKDIYARKRYVETLKSVGVEPKLPLAVKKLKLRVPVEVERIKSVGVDPKLN